MTDTEEEGVTIACSEEGVKGTLETEASSQKWKSQSSGRGAEVEASSLPTDPHSGAGRHDFCSYAAFGRAKIV